IQQRGWQTVSLGGTHRTPANPDGDCWTGRADLLSARFGVRISVPEQNRQYTLTPDVVVSGWLIATFRLRRPPPRPDLERTRTTANPGTMWAMLMHALYLVGKRIIGGGPPSHGHHAPMQTPSLCA